MAYDIDVFHTIKKRIIVYILFILPNFNWKKSLRQAQKRAEQGCHMAPPYWRVGCSGLILIIMKVLNLSLLIVTFIFLTFYLLFFHPIFIVNPLFISIAIMMIFVQKFHEKNIKTYLPFILLNKQNLSI